MPCALPEPLIVGVGGSALDIAKQVAAVIRASESIEHYLLCAHSFAGRAPLITVPATSGTGAEVTSTCVARIAAAREVTSSQAALNWVTNRAGVTSTLVGVETAAQLDEQIAALGLQLTPAEERELDRLYTPSDVINDHNVNRIPRMVRPPSAAQQEVNA